jgi:cytochrome c553
MTLPFAFRRPRLLRGLVRRLVFLPLLAAGICAAQAPAASTPATPAPKRAPDTMAERVAACVACHGAQGRATTDGYYPRIAGKPAGYLFNQLVNFREGRRDNATMRYLVSNLPDAYLREIAQYFSGQNPPYAPPQPSAASAAELERGRTLVFNGDPSKNIPACAACHGAQLTGTAPAIPGLLGLPRDYLNAQFGAWSNKARHAHKPDCMAVITSRLSGQDLGAITAWLSAQPVPEHARPAPVALEKLPLECGGVTDSVPAAGAQGAAK